MSANGSHEFNYLVWAIWKQQKIFISDSYVTLLSARQNLNISQSFVIDNHNVWQGSVFVFWNACTSARLIRQRLNPPWFSSYLIASHHQTRPRQLTFSQGAVKRWPIVKRLLEKLWIQTFQRNSVSVDIIRLTVRLTTAHNSNKCVCCGGREIRFINLMFDVCLKRRFFFWQTLRI